MDLTFLPNPLDPPEGEKVWKVSLAKKAYPTIDKRLDILELTAYVC